MSVYNQRLLTPPDEEEIYPYRRVWRSFVVEATALFGIAALAFIVFRLINLQLPAALIPAVNGLLIAAPVLLWLIVSVWREQFVPQPRPRLIAIFVITALAANAVAIPFIDAVFQPDRWLPLAGAIDRIIGYTFTVGIVQETVKYAVVRFVAWPDLLRTRLDSAAYCAAAALGYAFVLNLRLVLNAPGLPPDVVATEMFGNVAVNLAGSLIVSYGLAEVRFDQPLPFLMAITVALAALLNGIVIPLRSGLVNGAFSLNSAIATAPSFLDRVLATVTGSAPKPLLGFAFSGVVLMGITFVISFLYSSAERQAREAAASREV